MNEQISWDPSLVKKFSSSNHYKLLNQLRTEVKKYPLNNKKNLSSSFPNNNKLDKQDNTNTTNLQNISNSYSSNSNKDITIHQSTVSFNNSKNFSIYNNNNDESTKVQRANNISDDFKRTHFESSLTSFKDRLNQVDMK
tara:strand:+ start:344 stop:760 length:417 start_codon:yes stop_codon:yes gene_type:complete